MNIPARFNRVAAAFRNQAAKVRPILESSGSEHSAEDLCDLVNSFLERGTREERSQSEEFVGHLDNDEIEIGSDDDCESRDELRDLFGLGNDAVKRSIHAAVERAYREVGGSAAGSSSPEFKRQLMARLRSRGFDAGLCKSRWEKNCSCPAGDYEYVDVNAAGNRYIVQVLLDGEFTIARPNGSYASLLEILPPVFVGRPEELKQVLRIMCAAVRKSMTSAGFHVPPWRSLAYMQNKWFGAYKRTTNEINPNEKGLNFGGGSSSEIRSVGLMPIKGIMFKCRDDFGAKGGVRIGNLALN